MLAHTLAMGVDLLWPINEHLPNAAILVSIWEQNISIINILLLMKDTVISPNETAQGGCAQWKYSMSSQSCGDAVTHKLAYYETPLPSFGSVQYIL